MRELKALVSVALICSASLVAAEGKSIIVLDGSGSMWGQIEGRAKLEIAREALANVLSGLAPETELGLMAYGHREKGNCGDIELMVAPAAGSGPAIAAAANAMQFLGKTPLTEAVRRAAAELRSTEEKATVILITDGIETCEADPCALGAELEASGIDFTAHVVGFGLSAEDGQKVACLAQNTGGQYIEAKDAGSLTSALQATVAAAPEVAPAPVAEPEPEPAPEPEKPVALTENFRPILRLAPNGPELGDDISPSVEIFALTGSGSMGERVHHSYGAEAIMLPAGRYSVSVQKDQAAITQEVEVAADTLNTPEIILDAGFLTIRPLITQNGETQANSAVSLRGAGGVEAHHYGEQKVLLPSGEYEAEVTIGKAAAKAVAVVEAGQSTTVDVIVATGLAVIDTYYTADMIMEDLGQSIAIYEAKAALDGSRKSVAGGYGAAQEYLLPPGDYIAVGDKEEAEAEVAFTVKANERIAVPIVLNAGVLAVSAPGARGIQIFHAKKSIQGDRKSVRYDYGETTQATILAGDYIIEAEVDGAMKEASATVIAGERAEVTLP